MKCPEPYSPEKIVALCTAGGQPMHQMINSVLKTLLKCAAFTKNVTHFVRFRGGSTADAEDIIMEGLIQTAKHLSNNRYKAKSNIANYAFGICKYKWFNVMNAKGLKTVPVDESARNIKIEDNAENWLISEESKKILWSIIGQQKGNCPKYLKFWMLNYTKTEIAQAMNVEENNVRQRTYKCRMKLKEWLSQHPKYQTLLKGIRWN